MSDQVVLCGLICITVIILYVLSIAKSKVDTKRLEMECKANGIELELLRQRRNVRPLHKPVD